jgi:hypothetical protein
MIRYWLKRGSREWFLVGSERMCDGKEHTGRGIGWRREKEEREKRMKL